MTYVFFLIPGFLITALSVLQHDHPLVLAATGLAWMAAFIMHSSRWMGLVLLAGLIGGALAGEAGLQGIAIGSVLGWLFSCVGMAARCPRCRYILASRRQSWCEQPPARWCTMCGRDRKGVWPLQYLFKPEPWDGHYHDEGGGPGDPDSFVDWQRDRIFRRLPKALRRD